jgi:peptidyl-prolyl cis-trans isomerase SurA
MRTRRLVVWLALAAAAVLLGAPRPAQAGIVERIVAVIGERPILWTELLHRAAPARMQIRAGLIQKYGAVDVNIVTEQEQEMYKELLQHMIEDRLEEQQADRAHITITPEEIDRGLANLAAQAQQQQGRPVTVEDVIAEVSHRGMTEQDFREEIRRQLLEGKLIELRVRPRVRVTDQDARAAYQHWTDELKQEQPVDVRILALRVLAGSTPQQIQARQTLAVDLVRRARAGEDFCKLVQQYSDDVQTQTTCGSRGAQPLNGLLPPIREAALTLRPGAFSDPITIGVSAEQAIVIVQPLGAARIPSFDDVKNEMMQRALLDALERARKQWLLELRHNVYIDIRL